MNYHNTKYSTGIVLNAIFNHLSKRGILPLTRYGEEAPSCEQKAATVT